MLLSTFYLHYAMNLLLLLLYFLFQGKHWFCSEFFGSHWNELCNLLDKERQKKNTSSQYSMELKRRRRRKVFLRRLIHLFIIEFISNRLMTENNMKVMRSNGWEKKYEPEQRKGMLIKTLCFFFHELKSTCLHFYIKRWKKNWYKMLME